LLDLINIELQCTEPWILKKKVRKPTQTQYKEMKDELKVSD